ncbi:MAG: sugar transporter [Thalassovita sp.]|nr:sugar transporter [Thalassovita sp.]
MTQNGPAANLQAVQQDDGDQDETQQKKIRKLRQRAKEAEAARDELLRQLQQDTAFPLARPAHMKRRHWGLVLGFVLMVLLPLSAAAVYLWTIAEDQYVSTTGFTVRSQEMQNSADLLGGIATLAGSGTASESDILYEYIRSPEIVAAVDRELDLRSHYGAHWPSDWAFAIWPDATLETLTWYWQRVVRISYDSGSGLIDLRAVAYDPDMAQAITQAIVQHSQAHLNGLNEQARADAMRYAQADLDEALSLLKAAREALIQFRTRTRIVDPEADIQGRMGVVNNLQQQLAEALIEYDLLRGSVTAEDPRLTKALQRIDVIRDRIDIERQSFASSEPGVTGEDYPSLISEFERLTVDREFAEESYRAALAALEVARDDATRQSRYLATYINPTRAESSQYPRRVILTGLLGLFLLLGWAIIVLIYYSIRDRS